MKEKLEVGAVLQMEVGAVLQMCDHYRRLEKKNKKTSKFCYRA
jgi:hypothetical protein